MHMRCAAHILNLIVNDGLKDLSPSIVAIRNAIRYVRSSPQRLQKFKQAAHAEKISSGASLCFDVPTRWNSTYIMLEHAIPFQKAFDRLEDEDEGYVTWFKEDRQPSIFDWDNARAFVQFLKLFYERALHHPFTAPNPEDMNDLLAYDMVHSGVEIGGGSLRIYKRDIQQKVLEIVSISMEQITSTSMLKLHVSPFFLLDNQGLGFVTIRAGTHSGHDPGQVGTGLGT
ncbi:hypothetical protein L6164_002131 [Bauhinia variegata]|uniref:Uncharacterized protein n=1 Tax=Bauhinia variegata TaxID=167791 RepID=A0ACB9PZZ8_BAUVA|nr:hypothetical protein L6164_002131 [Bauhinia variegata]